MQMSSKQKSCTSSSQQNKVSNYSLQLNPKMA